MKINAISVIDGMSGKLSKKEDLVFSNRFGDIHAWRVNAYRGPFNDKQTAVHSLFSQASALAATDMADPVTKAEWAEVARNSKGKWKTARGAAFASHFATLKSQAGE